MTHLYANNAAGTLSSGITNVSTSLTLNAGQGSLFPNPGAGQDFYMTLTDAATQTLIEIVLVTARSGDVFSITRGQDGTSALSWNAGDIASQRVVAAELRAFSTVQSGNLLNIQTFMTPGTFTYTPTAGAGHVLVKLQGGGGGGGGAPTTNASQVGVGIGGNAGAYDEYFGLASSQTITVGVAGLGGVAGSSTGGNGGNSAFGAISSAPGGAGGNSAGPTSPPVLANNGNSDATPSGGYLNVPGQRAIIANVPSLSFGYSGAGASTPYGRGGTPVASSGGGIAANGFGAGGSGGLTLASQLQVGGGQGAPGFVIIYEFS